MNTIYRFFNALVAAIFGSTLAYAVYVKATDTVNSLDDVTLCGAGVLVFVAFVVVAWFVIDKAPRAI